MALAADHGRGAALDVDTLTTLYAGALGRVEHLTCSGQRRERGLNTSSKHFHMVLPLSGSFVWHPGREEIFADSANVVFARGGEDFAISHPAGGDRSLVIWPNLATLEEVTGVHRQRWSEDTAFAVRTRRSTHQIQVAERSLLAACRRRDGLTIEERLVRLLSLLLEPEVGKANRAGASSRTVARAKSLLQERMPERLTLREVAREVGVSPIYLTQLFRQVEGIPLYQYALNLRMAAALDALSESCDLTRLAIDLGFSSHSHFTAAFRSRFGVSPSRLRAEFSGDFSDITPHAVRPLCSARGGLVDWHWS
jgi:AraC family transcriptional regulator